ncbi:MAG: hypothetical protein ABF242_00985 [Flavobacteriales bacterium]
MPDKEPIIKSRKILTTIKAIEKSSWESVVNDKNIYLSIGYLKALEESMRNEIDFYYSISYNQEDEPVLVSAFQIVTFTDKRQHNENQLISCVSRTKSKLFTFNVLVCGNVFSDGENGFIYSDSLSKKAAINEMVTISKQIKKISKNANKKAYIYLFKEFWAKENRYGQLFKSHSFREFNIDVNMILPIHESWNNMEEYLFSLKTKYRTRAKGVFKKSKDIQFRDFSSQDILDNKEIIERLFENVSSKSNFSFGKIKPIAFVKLKTELGSKFILRAAYLGTEIVGFSTAFSNNNVLEANYVGINYAYNTKYTIYQKLLYDYIEQAITLKAKELHLGRTSELIKSAIGAVPENMNLYAKHNNMLHNLALKPIFYFISPSKFELRKPFKQEYSI